MAHNFGVVSSPADRLRGESNSQRCHPSADRAHPDMNQVSPVPTLARLSRTERRVPRFRTQKTEGKNCPKRSSNRCHAFTNSQYSCVAYAPVCGKRATLLGDADESHRMGGTGQPAGMLRGQLFGPGGNTTPEFWIDGRPIRAARRRHSGKGRAVPERPPVDPLI